MSDSALVYTILLVGGALYLAIILWATVTSVRESDANNPPPSEH
jgi:threonine/homoserine/homoserine lactone efflux protein